MPRCGDGEAAFLHPASLGAVGREEVTAPEKPVAPVSWGAPPAGDNNLAAAPSPTALVAKAHLLGDLVHELALVAGERRRDCSVRRDGEGEPVGQPGVLVRVEAHEDDTRGQERRQVDRQEGGGAPVSAAL